MAQAQEEKAGETEALADEGRRGKGRRGSGDGSGRRRGRGTDEPGQPQADAVKAEAGPGFITSITAINGNMVTFAKPGEANETKEETEGWGRRGRGRGRADGAAVSLPVTEETLITSATLARRTQELLVGLELSGGLTNKHFQGVRDGGVKARITVEEGTIAEINVIIPEEESSSPIAVKPKRPPLK